MATFPQALAYEIRSNSSGITGITSTRARPVAEMPQGTDTEYLTWQRISALRHPHQGAAAGLVEARYQFNCYGATVLESTTLAAAVVAKFAHYRDATMGESGDSVVLKKSYILTDDDQSTPPTDRSQRGPIWSRVDVMFSYVE